MGIAYAALAPGAVATAIGLWGTRRAGGDLPARLHRRGRPRRGAGDPRAAAAVRPAEAGDDGAQATATTGCSTAPSRCSPGATECELFLVAAEAEGIGPALFVVESGTKGLTIEDEPAMGLRPAATGRLLLEGARVPADRAARRGQARGLRRVRQPRADRLVRARGRHRAGGARLRHPLRQRAPGLRRTDLQPPGRRLRGLRHRHRVERHAARHLPGGQPRRPAARTSPARRRSPAGSAPRRG